MRTLTPRLAEDQFIASIVQALGDQPRTIRVGIGDDAAVWKVGRSHLSLITTDALIDGVHFRLGETTPHALGHKALAVNLSDIAAMGGVPTLAVVALGISDEVDEEWARDFYGGMSKLAKSFTCAVAGGDIVRAPSLLVSVTVVGEVRKSNLRLRSGARPGDYACITGPLGLSAAALVLRNKRSNGPLGPLSSHVVEILRSAYETPSPRVAEGKFLGASRATHAMMDISDGLSLDAARMARASSVDVCIDLDALQPHPALREFLTQCGKGPSGPFVAHDLMLHGGDDYELLVAVEPRAYPHLAQRFRSRFKRVLAAAGRFEKGSGKVWVVENGERAEQAPRGYDHLRRE